MAFDQRYSVTIGRALPGMQNIGRNAASNIRPTDQCVELIAEASTENGCVKVELKDERLHGQKMFNLKVSERDWEEKLDELSTKVESVTPCYFVLYRAERDVLFVKYLPEDARTRVKMLYASSTQSVKDIVSNNDPETRIEEYNVSEPSELSYAEYRKMKDIEAPLTEAEIQRQEQDAAETAGGYSLLARLSFNPVALPGLTSGTRMPRVLSQGGSDDEGEDADEEEPAENDGADASEDRGADEEDDEVGELKRRSSTRSKKSSKSRSGKSRSSRRSSGTSRRSEARRSEAKEPEAKQPEPESDDDVDAGDEDLAFPYTYKDLLSIKEQGEYDDNMNPANLEQYMVGKEFKKVFKMTKAEFKELPKWRQVNLKKQAKLF